MFSVQNCRVLFRIFNWLNIVIDCVAMVFVGIYFLTTGIFEIEDSIQLALLAIWCLIYSLVALMVHGMGELCAHVNNKVCVSFFLTLNLLLVAYLITMIIIFQKNENNDKIIPLVMTICSFAIIATLISIVTKSIVTFKSCAKKILPHKNEYY